MEELIDNIINLNSELDKFWNGNKTDTQIKKINKIQQESLLLINKYRTNG